MTNPKFPEGKYFSIFTHVRPGRGGLTRLMLMRQRLFYDAGIQMPLLTFDVHPDYENVRQQLVADSYMHPRAEIMNVWSWFVDNDLSGYSPIGEYEPINNLGFSTESITKGGLHWSTVFSSGKQIVAKEYYRPDGTLAIRHIWDEAVSVGLTPRVEVVSRVGQVIQRFQSRPELHRFWVTQVLAPGDENIFIISDSRVVSGHFLDMEERVFTLLQLHNPHSHRSEHFL